MIKDHSSLQGKKGTVIRVTGTIVDIEFPRDAAPAIFNEVQVLLSQDNHEKKAALEVAQHLGDGIVRCIALESIENIRRGLSVINTGGPIKVPVGKEVLG